MPPSHAARAASCKEHLLAVALVSEPLPSSHMLVTSARLQGYDLRLIVLNHSRTNFVYTRVEATHAFLRAQCGSTVVMFVDAYDVFFRMQATDALQRFREMGSDVIFSAERLFSGQDESDKPFWDELRMRPDAAGEPRGRIYGFLNSGGIMGVASALEHVVSEALTIQPGAPGWRNKTCGEPHGRTCADQWIYGHLLAKRWHRFNASLDYDRRIFYVASSHDWSYSYALKRINETQPCAVHMPFTQAPRVNATLHALYQGLVLGQPAPEADRGVCIQRAANCKEISQGVALLLHALDGETPANSLGRALPGRSLSNAGTTPIRENSMVKAALGGESRQVDDVAHPFKVACSGSGTAMRSSSGHKACATVASMINASTWAKIATWWKSSTAPTFAFANTTKEQHRRKRISEMRHLVRDAVWTPLPWCFEPGSGIRTTFISC